mgnify:CR=1 FL=1
MDKISLLQERKAKISESGKELRAQIAALTDENSFVELSAFSFSKNDFYGEDTDGEGVITGFATILDYPFYIVAQNFKVRSGGISKAQCDKIAKCLDAAEKNATPVIYLLNSQGVQLGEGVTVLEGLAKVLMRATQLKGVVPQYAVVNGEVYGSIATLCAIADFTFFTKKSYLAVNSPLVIAAKTGRDVKKEDVGAAKSLDKSGLVSFVADGDEEIRNKIAEITEIVSSPMIDAELNEACPELNAAELNAASIAGIFENAVEVNALCAPEARTYLCRIGGIAAAAVVFDGGENAAELNAGNLAKVREFAEFAACYRLPLIVFSDVAGITPCTCTNNSRVLKEAAEYLNILDTIDTAKIAVVYKRAIGLGYSLFAAKSAGFDYSCAFATAKIALFDDVKGAEIEFANEKADKAVLAERYADEKADPVNAAKDGYIDDVIEPQFVKQYLISALQMLVG